ncbi:hypothetical protein CBL_02959 [Carabus blaptoides fortunei]
MAFTGVQFADDDGDDLGNVRQLEYTSDIQTDDPENTTFPTKGPRITPRRLYDSCSSDNDDNNSVFVDSNVTSPKTQHLINVINSTQPNIFSYSTPVSCRGSTPTSKEPVRISGEASDYLKMHRTKCSALITNVIAPHFMDQLREDIGNGPFSILIDESTDIAIKNT